MILNKKKSISFKDLTTKNSYKDPVQECLPGFLGSLCKKNWISHSQYDLKLLKYNDL